MHIPEIAATLLGKSGDSGTSSLRAGQRFQTLVRMENGKALLQLGNQKVDLGNAGQAYVGKQVQVEVAQAKPQLVLRFIPEQAAPGNTNTQQPNLTQILSSLLPQFKGLNDAALGTRLLPTSMPMNGEAVRQWLSLFFSGTGLGRDLETLQTLVNQGMQQGALSPQLGQQLSAVISQWLAPLDGNLKQFLERMQQGKNTEARLAQAVKGSDLKALLNALNQDLRQQISQLRGNEAWLAYIRSTSQMKQFSQLAERILDHLEGQALQQLHRHELPYHYLEIPLGEQSGFHWAHVHYFGGNPTQPNAIKADNCTIVMDLNLSKLGEVWVMIRNVAEQCSCQFRVRETDIAEAIASQTETLQQSLSKAGFPGTQIQTRIWDGDRAAALGELFQRNADLTMKA